MILESLSFTKTLYAFDFDGTLSRIVKVPSEAKIGRLTLQLLQQLAGLAPVAVVSGRSLKDLKQRIICRPAYLVGNHGLEGLGVSPGVYSRAQESCDLWKAKLSGVEFGSGVEIEDKEFSLAIHYRLSRNKREVKLRIKEALESLEPLPRLITGKSVVNVLPVGAPHKGLAVLEMAKKLGTRSVLYVGDDDTDEDVFSLPDPGIMTVRVGKKASSQARYYLERQSEINELLKRLIQYHRPQTKPQRQL